MKQLSWLGIFFDFGKSNLEQTINRMEIVLTEIYIFCLEFFKYQNNYHEMGENDDECPLI